MVVSPSRFSVGHPEATKGASPVGRCNGAYKTLHCIPCDFPGLILCGLGAVACAFARAMAAIRDYVVILSDRATAKASARESKHLQLFFSRETYAALLPPEAVRLLKLIAQLRRAQIFAQMRQALLQGQQARARRLRYWCRRCRATWRKGSRPAASSRAARGRPHL